MTQPHPHSCADNQHALGNPAGSICTLKFRTAYPARAGRNPFGATFEQWLSESGLAGAAASPQQGALQHLWGKARESVQLRQLLENMKECELEIAAKEAEDSARHFDMLVGAATAYVPHDRYYWITLAVHISIAL